MEKEVLIKVEGVSKKFCKNLRKSLVYGVKDSISEMIGGKSERNLRKDEFWAINDVSFEVRRGECLGLIGHNGAGKSTLLKMLNGLIKPDKGRIEMRGRVGALIELGAGFNPILTGRENIYNNGAVLGFTKAEIDKKFDEIVEFSEIEEFIDSPVQNYSSGMKVRLGFAVAANMEPDILLIDEVLAVGDVDFRAKCYDKLSQIFKDCSIIFVSHSLPAVNRIVTEVLYLKNGLSKSYKNVADGLEKYLESSSKSQKEITFSQSDQKLVNYPKELIVESGDEMSYEFDIVSKNVSLVNSNLYVNILTRDQNPIGFCYYPVGTKELKPVEKIQMVIPELILTPGEYFISIVLYNHGSREQILWYQNVTRLKVVGENHFRSPIKFQGLWKVS